MKKIILIITAYISTSYVYAQDLNIDFESQKKKAIKVELFSPLTGNTTLGYENYIKDWISLELKVGAIGIGSTENWDPPRGVMFKVGPKFKLRPSFATDDTKGVDLLGGKYIRPEIAFSRYSEKANATSDRRSFTAFALLITYGKQVILADVMTLDYHVGIGYGYTSSEEAKYNYGFSAADPSFPLAVSAGLTIGFLF